MPAFTRQHWRASTDPIVRVVFGEILDELALGLVPNVFHAMAPMPELLDAAWCLTRATLLRGRVSRTVKEMAGLVVSIVNASGYSRSFCLQSLTSRGVDVDTIARVACADVRGAGLSTRDGALLDLARAIALHEGKLRDADRVAATAAGVAREEALEMAATVQLFTSLDRFAAVAGAPPDLW